MDTWLKKRPENKWWIEDNMQTQVRRKIAQWTLPLIEKSSFSPTLLNYNNYDLIGYDKKLAPEIQNHR